jgi:hypothetical protein
MNSRSERVKVHQITVSELVDHYWQRELKPDTLWKTPSTTVTYDGYLNKWIVPRWGNYALNCISAGEVKLWLRSLALAKSSCAKRGQTIMRSFIRPAAVKIGIAQHIGWHTFRHTYSSLLAAARVAASCFQPSHIGYVHSSSHNPQTKSSE